MQRNNGQPNPYFGIFISLTLGGVIGLMAVLLISALNHIEKLHQRWNSDFPFQLLLIPVVLLAILLIRRNTLFFPTKVSQLTETETADSWSDVMLPMHFLGTALSHLAGVSVGREGALVLAAGGLTRTLRLSWEFWGPVLTSIAFASVVGQYWTAPFFLSEMYGRNSLLQKIYSLIGAVAAVLTGSYFQVPHFFEPAAYTFEAGFFAKLIFFFLFAVVAGMLMRFYKKLYFFFSERFHLTSLPAKLLVSLVLAGFLYLPEFRQYQGLGLSQLQDMTSFQGSIITSVVKLFFTLISTTLGFLGGEFIPLVYSGVHLGSAFFSAFGYSSQLGALFGAFVLFAGGTRFKWTGIVMLLGLAGLQYWFWAYFVMATAVAFSGPQSLYRKKPETLL